MRCDEDQTRAVVHAALDAGINVFDTADVYGGTRSETFLGRVLRGMDRAQIVIATKFALPLGDAAAEDGRPRGGASRRYLTTAVEASLRRLGTDYVDLYQQHTPDPDTPIEETLRALDDLVRAGKVRYLGNSNFFGWQIADAAWTARQLGLNAFVSAQNQYNLLDRRADREVLPACRHFGLGLLPYFPLASGLLTGKYQRGAAPPADTRLAHFGERGRAALSERNFDQIDALTAWAAEQGRTLLELAMGWLVSDPTVGSVIAGATRPEQVAANVAAASWRLSPTQLEAVAGILR
jgi:aryl-alcohol dehydrogenase-like predicted oxidoreductase